MALAVSTTSGANRNSVQQADPTHSLKQALKGFEGILTDEQKRQFNTQNKKPDASSVIAFVADLDNSTSSKARRCVAPRLCTFLSATQQFVGVVDTFVSSHPDIAALVWGGVRLAILSASNAASYFEKVTALIMKIGKTCPTYEQFGQLYPNDVALQRALCDYYALMVRLCVRIIEISRRSAIKRTLLPVYIPFEAEFKDILDELDQTLNELRIQLSLAAARVHQETLRLVEHESTQNTSFRQSVMRFHKDARREHDDARELRIRKMKRDIAKLRSSIRKNLYPFDHVKPWKQTMRQRTPKTAEWMYQEQAFQDWQNDSATKFLWCSGTMGTGKSVLVSYVVAQLHSSQKPKDVVAYFFCRGDDETSLSSRNILGSVTYQLLKHQIDNAGHDALQDLQEQSETIDNEDVVEMLTVRLRMDETYYIILDGLDECDSKEVRILMKNLSQLYLQRNIKLKILIASRPELTDWSTTYLQPDHVVPITEQNTHSDIFLHIDTAVDNCLEDGRLQLGDQALRGDIIEVLRKGSHGMFLWTRLFLEELCAQNSDRQILTSLRKLPRGLSEIYDQKLSRIKGCNVEEEAIKLLQFCGVARRPLTISEYQEVLSVRPEQKSFDHTTMPNNMDLIVRNCCGLVFVDEEEGTTHYVHHSLKQHLFDPGTSSMPQFGRLEANLNLGYLCMTYLNFSDFSLQLAKAQNKSDACINPIQLSTVALGSSSKANRVVEKVLASRRRKLSQIGMQKLSTQALEMTGNSLSNRASRWSETFQFLNYAKYAWIYHLTDIDKEKHRSIWTLFCRCAGNEAIPAERLWTTEPQILANNLKFEGRPVEDLMSWILGLEHYTLLSYLAGSSPRVLNEVDLIYVLSRATHEKFRRLVDIVKEHGDVGTRALSRALALTVLSSDAGGTGRPPGFAATAGTSVVSVAKILLDAGSSPDVLDGHGTPLLIRAALKNTIPIIEMLLTARADLHIKDDVGRTALICAAEMGHTEAVKMLLDAGSDTEIRDDMGRTALIQAVELSHTEAIKMLLDTGSDTETKDNAGRTALMRAATMGDSKPLKMLLAAGADVNVGSEDGWTPLGQAAYKGRNEVVQMLLAAGADVSHEDKYGKSPVTRAVQQGHVKVLQTLLAAEADFDIRKLKKWIAKLDPKQGHKMLTMLEQEKERRRQYTVQSSEPIVIPNYTGVTNL